MIGGHRSATLASINHPLVKTLFEGDHIGQAGDAIVHNQMLYPALRKALFGNIENQPVPDG